MREAKEETGLEIVLGEKIGELETDVSHEHIYAVTSWSGTVALGGPETERQSPTNVYRLEWVPIGTLNGIDMREESRDLLLKYLNS